MRLPARLRAAVLPMLQAVRKRSLAQWIWIGAGGVLALVLVWMLWPEAQTVDVAVIDRGLVRREVVDEGRTRIHDIFVVAAPRWAERCGGSSSSPAIP
jgi:HlyD family secretion protein